ncbi:MAG: tetratricopeptide repeat protein [Actinomycetota bacterium]
MRVIQSRVLQKFFLGVVDPLIHGEHQTLASWIAGLYTRLNPRDHNAWVLLARCYGAFGDFTGEEVVLRRGLERIHDSDYLWGRLTASLIAQDRLEEGQEIIEDMKLLFSDSPYTWTWSSVLAARRDDLVETQAHLRAAIECLEWDGPSLPATADCCGVLAEVLIFKLREAEKAKSLLARVFDTRIRDARVALTLCVLKEIQGEPDAATVLEVARATWRGSARSFDSVLERERAQLQRAVA